MNVKTTWILKYQRDAKQGIGFTHEADAWENFHADKERHPELQLFERTSYFEDKLISEAGK